MKTLTSMLAALTLAASALPAAAHHSAALFDFAQRAHAEGVVKSIRVINPHMSLTLSVSDAKGTRDVDFEGHSVNNFYRAGWRPGMVKVGDRIKVTFAPRKDGADGGFINAFTTADGKEIGFKLPSENPTSGSATSK